MKLNQLVQIKTENRDPTVYGSLIQKRDWRQVAHPEVGEFLHLSAGARLSECSLLAMDEQVLAQFIRYKLYADPNYCPSMTLLTAIRSLNAKLAIGDHGAEQSSIRNWLAPSPTLPDLVDIR